MGTDLSYSRVCSCSALMYSVNACAHRCTWPPCQVRTLSEWDKRDISPSKGHRVQKGLCWKQEKLPLQISLRCSLIFSTSWRHKALHTANQETQHLVVLDRLTLFIFLEALYVDLSRPIRWTCAQLCWYIVSVPCSFVSMSSAFACVYYHCTPFWHIFKDIFFVEASMLWTASVFLEQVVY